MKGSKVVTQNKRISKKNYYYFTKKLKLKHKQKKLSKNIKVRGKRLSWVEKQKWFTINCLSSRKRKKEKRKKKKKKKPLEFSSSKIGVITRTSIFFFFSFLFFFFPRLPFCIFLKLLPILDNKIKLCFLNKFKYLLQLKFYNQEKMRQEKRKKGKKNLIFRDNLRFCCFFFFYPSWQLIYLHIHYNKI